MVYFSFYYIKYKEETMAIISKVDSGLVYLDQEWNKMKTTYPSGPCDLLVRIMKAVALPFAYLALYIAKGMGFGGTSQTDKQIIQKKPQEMNRVDTVAVSLSKQLYSRVRTAQITENDIQSIKLYVTKTQNKETTFQDYIINKNETAQALAEQNPAPLSFFQNRTVTCLTETFRTINKTDYQIAGISIGLFIKTNNVTHYFEVDQQLLLSAVNAEKKYSIGVGSVNNDNLNNYLPLYFLQVGRTWTPQLDEDGNFTNSN